MLNTIQTIILGLVEGVTEFLPISSTGHLILTSHLMGLSGDVTSAFEVFIQLGAILAVVLLYRNRFAHLFDFSKKEGFNGLNGWMLLIITSLPILILGKLTEKFIKAHLFTPMVVVCALAIGGIVIILVERIHFKVKTQTLDTLTPRQAFLIGIFQCFALCPGASRAASTIIGGLVAGLERKRAAEYSFLVAVPIMVIVSLKDLLGIWHQLSPSDIQMFGLGFVVAFVSAIFAVKLFIQFLQHHKMTSFGIYRILVAVVFFWVIKGF